ncbi:hypothetical protein [Actinotignum urinale]|uniref:hypothetical protein n=1 Tax=Actinotignum urinale TaxID=190146 RepID=UPI0003B32F48|nr:hypothetical protein [Actinotignum urinale]MDY5160981.1 hypothetical protein [Actinotignum urinale]
MTEWKNPKTGKKRYYLNGWLETLLCFERNYYKSGNIYGASVYGYGISNRKARYFDGKAYVEDGEVYVELSPAAMDTIRELHYRYADYVPSPETIINNIKSVTLEEYKRQEHRKPPKKQHVRKRRTT